MYCELFAILNSDVLLLTANQRLSEYLLRDYNRQQQEKNLKAWPMPNLLPLNTWLAQLWQQCPTTDGLLLNDFEENLLWQEIITQDEQTQQVLQLNQAVSLAKSAWHTLQQWQLQLNQLEANTNEEVAKFISLATQFENHTETHKLYTQVELPKLIQQLIATDSIKLPKSIILYGFDQLPPALDALIKTLSTKISIEHFQFNDRNHSTLKTSLADEDQEIRVMALWAKNKLNTLQPREKIGCVIPKLSQKRDQIVTVFTETFAKDNIKPGAAITPLPFNISAGIPLNHYPLVQSALQILSLNKTTVNYETLKEVLLSPYINTNDTERALSAMAEYQLASNNEANLTKKNVLATLTKLSQDHYPEATLPERWQQFCQHRIHTDKNSFASWVQLLQARLQAVGWPGQKTLSSPEYQVMQRWQHVLADLCKLDRTFPTVTFHRFLQILRELCQQTIFQPQSEDKPIQILGMLEAAGCCFRHLWLMGLDDEVWPDKANPNPFLPIDLQRKLQMPHSSAERELEFSTNLQSFLIRSSQEAILSYTEQQGDKTSRPSRLISQFADINLNHPTEKSENKPIPLESISDFSAPKVTEPENIRGGSWILKTQSICPFRAFATIRLQAKPMESVSLGLSAQTRGILTHFALETLWKKIKSQDQLTQLENTEVKQLIAQSIEQAITATNIQASAYAEIERLRLAELLNQWLDIEKTRPPFKVIERESTRNLTIGPLPVRIQIDRVDELSDGRQLIIDYKTGKQNAVSHWFGDRPRDPQLPLYFIYGCEQGVGLAYAEVNLASLKFKGLINSDATFSQVSSKNKNLNSWQELTQTWQQNLTRLAQEFIEGVATPTPLEMSDCKVCHLHGFCRIGEQA